MAKPSIDPKRTAVILHDFQNAIVMSKRPIVPWGQRPSLALPMKVFDHARKMGMVVVNVRIGYRQNLKNFASKAFTPGEKWGPLD